MKLDLVPILIMSVGLSGCATGSLSATGTFLPPVHTEKLLSAYPCCTTLREVRYSQLEHNVEVKAFLTPESQVFVFENGRSFIAAFELPSKESRTLTLKTVPVNMLWNRTGHVLIPAATFLDSEFRVVTVFKPTYEARYPKILGDPWAEATIAIPQSSKYFIISDAKSSEGIAWRDTDLVSGFLFVRSGPTGEFAVLPK